MTDSQMELPNNNEILDVMKKAMNDALRNAELFGMNVALADIVKCELRQQSSIGLGIGFSEDEEDFHDDYDEMLDEMDAEYGNSNFVQIENDDDSLREIRKSTLVWLRKMQIELR